MQSKATTPDQYMQELPEERKAAMQQLRQTILKNLPKGFEETMQYGMLGYVVLHSKYPSGYHCNPKDPLPFMAIASQKNYVAFYHMGIYADENLMNWFKEEYAKIAKGKLDMGKSCIRFKKMESIPYELLGQLCSKISVDQWIEQYENKIKR
ncbi:DUF1801 domain-containing protein [Aequorivita echinoideorum]|uniref:DUF1801 domain-containing protein n=1 Tax=Aequorivita echinoideorum TaxID=1549647 RepID=A0ABS5S4U2_9FLAO|nr:DUF1801 domain-containing protein [Aequorivita echinoideorum]MBT0608240.1 DUF1801 domain-containing protein [Aequorivita echinoideorum]